MRGRPEIVCGPPEIVQRARASRSNWTGTNLRSTRNRSERTRKSFNWLRLLVQNGPAHFSGPPGPIQVRIKSVVKHTIRASDRAVNTCKIQFGKPHNPECLHNNTVWESGSQDWASDSQTLFLATLLWRAPPTTKSL